VGELQFFNPYEEIKQTENRLPHWQQTGAVYFVTFHLADSLPSHLLTGLNADRDLWLRFHPVPWSPETEREYHQRFSGAVERWLDAGHGSCLLREPASARMVGEALAYFEGERCHQIAWIVMPNHVHALFIPAPGFPLEKLLHSWKSFTAHELRATGVDLSPVWMRDSFDRIVRDGSHFENCVRYIRSNPAKARLREQEFLHWEGDLARDVL
jgi:REP element-mobilizing transposase RayT